MDSPTPGALADSPAAPDYATYEREQNARDLGRTPTADRSPAPEPSSPDPDPGDTTPEQASADPPSATDDQKPKPKSLQTRREQVQREVAELQEQIRLKKALREELAALGTAPAANGPPGSAPAQPTKAAWERYKALPGAPKPEQFDTYEDFLDARADFIVEQRLTERERRSAAERESHERLSSTTKTIEAFRARVAKAKADDPAWEGTIHPSLLTEVVPAFALRADEPTTAANVLMQCVVESEAAPALLAHFSTPDGQAAWRDLVQTGTPADLVRRFGRLEAKFLDVPPAAAPAAAKPVTKAPPPPTTLGTQPPASPDRVAAAVAKRDYSSYEAAQNAADLARRRRA